MDGLKLVIDKLSQYNFLTNILPGTILCIILKYIVGYDFMAVKDWYLLGVTFYFIGMINNRFGSLVIEWLCRKTKFVTFAPYPEFVKAEKNDNKLITLSMENNVFRSYISVCVLSLLSAIYKFSSIYILFLDNYKMIILMVLLFVLFLFSYRKQARYVRKRVENDNK